MKRATLVYTGFTTAILIEAAIFITATSYHQLAVAILLYIPLVYFALKLFPRDSSLFNLFSQAPSPTKEVELETVEEDEEVKPVINKAKATNEVEISDINKRAFLKLIGATGISFFIASLLSKSFGSFLGKGGSGTTTIQDSSGKIINPAKLQPTDNYIISETAYGTNNYYGFIDQGSGWYIMKQDLTAGTFRYIKGENNFDANWSNRVHLNYDLYNKVFLN